MRHGRSALALIVAAATAACTGGSSAGSPQIVYVTLSPVASPSEQPAASEPSAPTGSAAPGGGAASQTPASTTATPPVATPVGTVQPTTAPSASAPAPSATAAATPAAATAAEQRRLAAEVEAYIDVSQHCRRKTRDELPAGAVAGLECEPPDGSSGGQQTDVVGFHLYRSRDVMYETYHARLVREGVTQRDFGDCEAGSAGERAHAGLASEHDDRSGRVGCFVNRQGFANVRWTWDDVLIYGGLLGDSGNLAAVYDSWADMQRCDPCTPRWGDDVGP